MEEVRDSAAAYTQSLMWIFTGDERYARNASAIIDAWTSTLQGHGGPNWYLGTAWCGSIWPLSGELLRATYPAWTGAPRLSKMLNDIYLPVLHNRMAFGNRELAVCNAMAAIGVFNDDPAAFDEAINHWQTYVPEYYYSSKDGPEPAKPDYWLGSPNDDTLNALDAGRMPTGWISWIDSARRVQNLGDDRTMLTRWTVEQQWKNPGAYIDGYSAETGGRDLGHAEAAFDSTINLAEIAWHQGIDMYSPYKDRLTTFIETTAGLRLGAVPNPAAYQGVLKTGNGINATYEIAYNHYHNIMGIDLPVTDKFITQVSRNINADTVIDAPFPSTFPANLYAHRLFGQADWISNWETLTHAELNAK